MSYTAPFATLPLTFYVRFVDLETLLVSFQRDVTIAQATTIANWVLAASASGPQPASIPSIASIAVASDDSTATATIAMRYVMKLSSPLLCDQPYQYQLTASGISDAFGNSL